MKVFLSVTFASVCWLFTPFICYSGEPAKDKPTATEIAQLPHFCWSQYIDGVSGYEYTTRRQDCGPGMNHYCAGLVALIRARKGVGGARGRLDNLKHAKNNTRYTLEWMKDYPNCSLRSHVESTQIEINGRLMGLGQK